MKEKHNLRKTKLKKTRI